MGSDCAGSGVSTGLVKASFRWILRVHIFHKINV